MAHKSLVPKQRTLTETETQTSLDCWREAMIFHIALSDKSARFLSSGDLHTWSTAQNRGFEDDISSYDADKKMNAAAKSALLEIILGSISSYAPVISNRFIKQQATSLESIWERLRSFYGFRKTGGRILKLLEFTQNPNESREALWERLYSYMEDNLLTKSNEVQHECEERKTNEEFTPTLLNVLVTCWLNILNPALPSLVGQKFAVQLRANTPYTIREEISDAVPNLLAEMEERESNVCRSGAFQKGRTYSKGRKFNPGGFSPSKRSCCLCEASGRVANHFLSTCPYLPPDDKRFFARNREVLVDEEEEQQSDEEEIHSLTSRIKKTCVKEETYHDPYSKDPADVWEERTAKALALEERTARTCRVDIVRSPVMSVSVNSMMTMWTLDCGAETNLILASECRRLGLSIRRSYQRAKWGDGKTWIHTIGEVHFTAIRDHHVLKFSGLVVEGGMDTPVLAGAPFLKINDLSINFSSQTIYLGDCCKVRYNDNSKTSRHQTTASVMRVGNQMCILPGDSVSFQLPDKLRNEGPIAVEPRTTVPQDMPKWVRCDIITPDPEGCIRIQNPTTKPVYLSKHTQVCQVRPTITIDKDDDTRLKAIDNDNTNQKGGVPTQKFHKESRRHPVNMLPLIKVDPSNILSKNEKLRFTQLHKKYESVFSGEVGCYNGYSGRFSHVINMGLNLPPQRRGRIPIYDHKNKELLQDKLDELMEAGVLSRAEDIGVPVEYVHPCFLVKKSSGGHRLVSPFGEVAEYARPQPTITSNVEHVILQIGQWKHLIKCDLKSAYFQIPLDPQSCKYVGVMTPFKGTFVYRRSVMGLPGSEAALEELLNRIFGDMIKERKMVKIADDFYLGSNTIDYLISSWEKVLHRLSLNGLKLSADKTICCPTSTNILGWQWKQGTITASAHHINALTVCEPPPTVKGLRSYVGCFKFISRVLPNYAEVLQPLEEACGGKESKDKITWTDELTAAFNLAKDQLKKAKPVVLPRNEEQLHIITDAAVNCAGIAATLLVNRNGKPAIVGHFNASLKKNQQKLLPCEMEALAIGVAIKHFSYYISQSRRRTRVLTDSRPCVLSYKKLMRGEFSSSPKVTTFLAIASRYNIEIMHITGESNTFTDFMSRNPVKCNQNSCQICKFAEETSISSVGEVRVSDIMSGESKIPFATKTSWIKIQQSCPDLLEVLKYMTTGASIPKKRKDVTDIRRYMNVGVKVVSTQKGNLLVVKQPSPFKATVDRVVIPKESSEGLLTALHVELEHPSSNQLKMVFSRAFFCLDMDAKARKVVESCYTCASLKTTPSIYHKQSTSAPSETIGSRYSADIIKRYCQNVLIVREDISSFTDAVLVDDEKAETLKDGILLLMSRLRSPLSPQATIRTDPATSLRSLTRDRELAKLNLIIEVGEPKNINHNPIAEKAIRELQEEIVRVKPLGGKLSHTELAQAVSRLNSRIRYSKLSAMEMFTSRDMTTGDQLSIDDKKLIADKQGIREDHHHASARYKARGKEEGASPKVSVGDMVYIFSDRTKLRQREKYLVTKTEDNSVNVQKFTGNQFRSREYRVKKSDVIVIPTAPTDKEKTEIDKTIPEKPRQAQTAVRSKIYYNSKPPKQSSTFIPIQTHQEESSSEESESEDDIINIPNMPHTIQVDTGENTIQNQRPIRERKAPEYLNDYVQNVSLYIDDEEEDNEEFGEDEELPSEGNESSNENIEENSSDITPEDKPIDEEKSISETPEDKSIDDEEEAVSETPEDKHDKDNIRRSKRVMTRKNTM